MEKESRGCDIALNAVTSNHAVATHKEDVRATPAQETECYTGRE